MDAGGFEGDLPLPEVILPAPGTVIRKGMLWQGDLVAAEDLLVEGTLEGTIESTGHVRIGPGGRVRGRISAARVLVEGTVEGDVAAARLIRVERSGRVQGDLEARSVSMAEGARVGGQIRTLDDPVPASSRPAEGA